jgi:hypothetical protein
MTLPEIYRKSADLILETGKTEGTYRDQRGCLCTMGAPLQVTGHLQAEGSSPDPIAFNERDYVTDPEFIRIMTPIADQIVRTNRAKDRPSKGHPGPRAHAVIYHWNDVKRDDLPTAEDVAALLRETADHVEKNGDAA